MLQLNGSWLHVSAADIVRTLRVLNLYK